MKIAVLGAGFSGMLAAYLLEKEGASVTVYEKTDHIGGHCRTLTAKDNYTDLGTTFTFASGIKELLIELDVAYTERLVYRSFVDAGYEIVQHMKRKDIIILMDELTKLQLILDNYADCLNGINYGYIHPDLMIPLSDFLKNHDLGTVYQVIAPHLSSFGFGSIDETQAYYAFKVFNVSTIFTFIRGEKLLFIDKGTSELIDKLGANISDIRYEMEVINIEPIHDQVKVETAYGDDVFDHVLITTKLPRDVIKDHLFNGMMKKIDTNPYITCAYEVNNRNLATTYFKDNLGKKGRIQFFHTSRQNKKTTLVAFAYGHISKEIVNGITEEINKTGVHIDHLITAKQWYIFPHLRDANLTEYFYQDILERQKDSHIHLIGSLISKPEMANLYISVKASVEEITGH